MGSIELIVYDFDGVMTDNHVYIDEKGNEMVRVNRAVGLALSEIRNLGIKQIIISTENNPVVSERARKVKVPCLKGVSNKKNALKDYCRKKDINMDQVGFVGNDINDKEAMENSGFSFCPSDAHHCIKNISDHVMKTMGGAGIVRELLDLLKEHYSDD